MNFLNALVCSLFLILLIYNQKEDVAILVEVPLPSITVLYVQDQDEIINEFSVENKSFNEIEISRISAYNPVPRQTDSDPDVSSCGPNLDRQIAVSRDLFFDENGRKHLCGVVVTIITNRGEVFTDYVIWDTMASRFFNTVDIMINNDDEEFAYSFGITSGTLIMHH